MSFSVTLTQLIEIIHAKPVNLATTSPISGIQTDTRSLKAGEIFVALRGEKFDGHNFVATAIAQGAIAAIVDCQYQNTDLPILQVTDTLQAYQQIATWWRKQLTIPVIGITGSVGKTTTKEIVAAVLATQGRVHKTYANYNNEIGVARTLLEINSQHDYAVIEMAMRGRGEIAQLTQMAIPTIGVITNVGTAHIERLGSEKAIAEAKCEMLAEMPADSMAILNHDNPLLIETAAEVWHGKTLTYGLDGGDIYGKLVDQQVEICGMQIPLPLSGRHNAMNLLAALAVAQVLGIDWSTLKSGVTVNMPAGRSQRYQLPNDVVILDETYNAAPEAMVAAVNLLAETPGLRRIAVLGAMKELGERSLELHQRVGETVRKLNLDALLILADNSDAEAIALSAIGIPCECFHNHSDLVERLKTFVKAGDRILFKAANSVGLDRVVTQFRREFIS